MNVLNKYYIAMRSGVAVAGNQWVSQRYPTYDACEKDAKTWAARPEQAAPFIILEATHLIEKEPPVLPPVSVTRLQPAIAG